jgi:hypothetical protein
MACFDRTNIPEPWKNRLSDIHPRLRALALDLAWEEAERLYAKDADTAEMLRRNGALTSPISGLGSLQFIPFQLLGDSAELFAQAERMMRDESGAALQKWVGGFEEKGETVLVVGDLVNSGALAAGLADVLREHRVLRFVSGPGPMLDSALLESAREHGFNRYFVTPVSAREDVWRHIGVEGHQRTQRCIDDLFGRLRPNFVYAIDPIQSQPAALVLDRARTEGIEVMHLRAPERAEEPRALALSF